MSLYRIRLFWAVTFFIVSSSIAAVENDPFGTRSALNLPITPSLVNYKQPTVESEKEVEQSPVETIDYSESITSDVFGANLFTGAFAREGATQFNPDYLVSVGDNIQIRLWGAFEFDLVVQVDPKGNIFLPHAGPIQLLGVRNQDIQKIVDKAVDKVFRSNVYSYASLAAAQPVRVFVSGFVNRPGLYSGTSMDSLLHYLDQAGGIDTDRGSFLSIKVKRGEKVRKIINLYRFLLKGEIPQIQLADGDVIFVEPRQFTVKVSGLTNNAKRFEFKLSSHTVSDLIKVAKPLPEATHIRIIRNTGKLRNIEYHPLNQASEITLINGDELEYTSDKKLGTITVRVEGETTGAQEYVLPYGARMGSLLQQVEYTERADSKSIQLFRLSVKDRQKHMLQTTIERLETSILTVRSGTAEESVLRKNESELMMQWIERAKNIEPSGQVVLTGADDVNELLLENGDIIKIPSIDNLVFISGEVLFPTAVALDTNKDVDDYIEFAGGYSQNADTSRIIIAHRDGRFEDTEESSGLFSRDIIILPGDEILVLPDVDPKYRQLFKELFTMFYQLALGVGVMIR